MNLDETRDTIVRGAQALATPEEIGAAMGTAARLLAELTRLREAANHGLSCPNHDVSQCDCIVLVACAVLTQENPDE